MLAPEDRQKVQELAKQAKELPNFNPSSLFDLFLGGNHNVIIDIMRSDDGKIDFKEGEILDWYFNRFEGVVWSDRATAEETIHIIFDHIFN